MQHSMAIWWDEATQDGYAYSYRPYPDIDDPDAGSEDYDDGPAGEDMPGMRGEEEGLAAAAKACDMDPDEAREWRPGQDGGYALWIVE